MSRRGNEHLETVLEDTAPDLLRYLLRRVSTPEDAADLLGQIGLAAWRRRAAVPTDPHEARLWLFGIARHTLTNHRRSSRRLAALTEQLKQQLGTQHSRRDIADRIADEQTVHAALEAIPAESAEILRLVHWEDLPLTEAATVLNIPASTARSRYATAKRRLRHHIRLADTPSRSTAVEVSSSTRTVSIALSRATEPSSAPASPARPAGLDSR